RKGKTPCLPNQGPASSGPKRRASRSRSLLDPHSGEATHDLPRIHRVPARVPARQLARRGASRVREAPGRVSLVRRLPGQLPKDPPTGRTCVGRPRGCPAPRRCARGVGPGHSPCPAPPLLSFGQQTTHTTLLPFLPATRARAAAFPTVGASAVTFLPSGH